MERPGGAPQGQMMSMEGTANGKGTVVLSQSGVYLGATSEDHANIKITITAQAMDVTVTTTSNDTNTANNQAQVTTPVQQADLAITKTASPDPVFSGSTITYTISCQNNGPVDAQNVVITGGVNDGDSVVALGVQKLDTEQRVRVVSSLSF